MRVSDVINTDYSIYMCCLIRVEEVAGRFWGVFMPETSPGFSQKSTYFNLILLDLLKLLLLYTAVKFLSGLYIFIRFYLSLTR